MDYNEFIETVDRLLGPLDAGQRERFRMMEGLYREWNAKINVISRQDIDSLYQHHVLHSLAIAGYMKAALPDDYALAVGHAVGTDAGQTVASEAGRGGRLRFLDLGTGGGFPGIPLAVMFPNARFTLCDSIAKKIRVAEDVASRLGLGNVAAVNARAESLTDRYDYIVSRAVAPLADFIPWTRGRFRRGILYLKGGDVAEETALMMARYRMKRGSVHTWRIDNWLNDSYFQEKFVIFIENFCK